MHFFLECSYGLVLLPQLALPVLDRKFEVDGLDHGLHREGLELIDAVLHVAHSPYQSLLTADSLLVVGPLAIEEKKSWLINWRKDTHWAQQ